MSRSSTSLNVKALLARLRVKGTLNGPYDLESETDESQAKTWYIVVDGDNNEVQRFDDEGAAEAFAVQQNEKYAYKVQSTRWQTVDGDGDTEEFDSEAEAREAAAERNEYRIEKVTVYRIVDGNGNAQEDFEEDEAGANEELANLNSHYADEFPVWETWIGGENESVYTDEGDADADIEHYRSTIFTVETEEEDGPDVFIVIDADGNQISRHSTEEEAERVMKELDAAWEAEQEAEEKQAARPTTRLAERLLGHLALGQIPSDSTRSLLAQSLGKKAPRATGKRANPLADRLARRLLGSLLTGKKLNRTAHLQLARALRG